MQSNEIKKKIEQKLTLIQRRIDEKEFEKSRKKQELKEKKAQRAALRSDDLKLTTTRNEIEREITSINGELRREKSEMSRLYADLVYKTRQEYEDMIKGYEVEMQYNNHGFRRNEETRILREIASLRNGITLLEKYDQKKLIVTNLQETLQLRINERDQNWTQHKLNNTKIHQFTVEINELSKEINQTNDLTEMNTLKTEWKKKLEDLNREINAKNQQLRKESLENRLRLKALKKDENLLAMEDTLRDLTKLINYYQKLIDSTGLGECQQQKFSKTTIDNVSSSLNSSNANDLSDQLANAKACYKKLSLTLSNDNTQNTSQTSSEISSSSSRKNSSSLSTPSLSALNTPTNESFGSFVIRKSLEDTRTKKQIRKQKANKINKVAHSVDIINLLSKMNVPLQLYSQFDECLKELQNRRDDVMCQIQLYETANATRQSIDSIQRVDEMSSSDCFESNSFDSNYESDNNSVTSFQMSITNALEKLQASNNTFKNTLFEEAKNNNNINTTSNMTTDIVSTSLDLDRNLIVNETTTLMKIQCETVNFAFNSDDSDATINEPIQASSTSSISNDTKRNSVPRLLIRSNSNSVTSKLKIKTKDSSSKSSSASSDSTTTPGSPKTPTPYSTATDKIQDTESELIDRSIDLKPAIATNSQPTTDSVLNKAISTNFMRQLSDGYSSSNTPLSASSINNESPTVNPFFQNNNNTKLL